MGERVAADVLRGRLRSAFPVLSPPVAVVERADHCSFCSLLHERLSGRPWSDIPPSVLDEVVDSNAQLLPEAFVYYLPAFLSRAVEYPFEEGLGSTDALEFMIYSLCDPDLPADEFWIERFRLLSKQQVSVVVLFLTWAQDTLSGDPDEESLAETVTTGLNAYWRAREAAG